MRKAAKRRRLGCTDAKRPACASLGNWTVSRPPEPRPPSLPHPLCPSPSLSLSASLSHILSLCPSLHISFPTSLIPFSSLLYPSFPLSVSFSLPPPLPLSQEPLTCSSAFLHLCLSPGEGGLPA